MMTRESRLELKVGTFVLIGFIAMSFIVASISDFSFAQKGTSYGVVFNFANGLRDAAPVRLAGVEAGLVKELELFVDVNDGNRTKVRAKIWLQDGIAMPADSTLTINQLGLLGEKYIEIIPGVSSEYVKPGSMLVGKDPLAMEKIMEQVGVIAQKVEVTIDGINNGLLTEQNKLAFANILDGLSSVSLNLKEGRGTVGKLLTDDAIFKNLDELTADLKGNPWKLLFRPKK